MRHVMRKRFVASKRTGTKKDSISGEQPNERRSCVVHATACSWIS